MAAEQTMDSLEQYRVSGVPEVFYVPDFVTEQEEEYLMRKVCQRNWSTARC